MKKLLTIAVLATIISSCQNEGQQDLNFKVNEATSKAEWKGSAPDHYHLGSFKVSGSLAANTEGFVKSGDFVIPIASIQDFDLKDPVRQVLLADLKDNFFKLAANPYAKFHLTGVTRVTGSNYKLTGNFTLLGQIHEISFPAKITVKGDSLITEAKFNLDRTRWGMHNYDDPAKKLYILPQVNIHLYVQAAAHTVKPLAYIGYTGGSILAKF